VNGKQVIGITILLLFGFMLCVTIETYDNHAESTTIPTITPKSSGDWYQGEVIFIQQFNYYDIIYQVGEIDMYGADIHVTVIKNAPSSYIIHVSNYSNIKLGEDRYRITMCNAIEGRITYDKKS